MLKFLTNLGNFKFKKLRTAKKAIFFVAFEKRRACFTISFSSPENVLKSDENPERPITSIVKRPKILNKN